MAKRAVRQWTARDGLRIVGGLLLFAAFVLVFPAVGAGSGKSYEPGSDTSRAQQFDHTLVGVLAVAATAGAILLLVSRLLPED